MDIYETRNELQSGKTIFDIPLRVTYYARVSTEKDEQLHSLSAQVRYYTQLIQGCPSWSFVEGYVDEGLSGTTVRRREDFLRMIEDARAGRFDFIVTKEISRFSRSTLDSIRYTQELLRSGVGVLFQSDNINTLLPDAELRLTIMSSIAQDEVRKLSERVRFGFRRAIEHGVVLGNSRIWGYEKRDGKLVVKEDEAEMVRAVFDLYANRRMGVRAIADHLSRSGYRNTRGEAISFSTVRGILGNPKYKGYYCGGKSCKYDYKLRQRKHFPPEEWVMYRDEQAVPPIVSEELWEKASRILAGRARARGQAGSQNRYPYSGKILCAVHRQPYYRALYRGKAGDREVWQCREYSRRGRQGCASPILYTAELDDMLRQCLAQFSPHYEALTRELVCLYAALGSQAGVQGETARCRAARDELLRRKDRLLELNMDGHISDQEFTQRNQRFNGQLQDLDRRLDELEAQCARAQRLVSSPQALEQAIRGQLEFPAGFTAGVVDALLDHAEVQAGEGGRPLVRLVLRAVSGEQVYAVCRERGRPSVCIRQSI